MHHPQIGVWKVISKPGTHCESARACTCFTGACLRGKRMKKPGTLTQSFTRVYTDPGLKRKGLKVGVQT